VSLFKCSNILKLFITYSYSNIVLFGSVELRAGNRRINEISISDRKALCCRYSSAYVHPCCCKPLQHWLQIGLQCLSWGSVFRSILALSKTFFCVIERRNFCLVECHEFHSHKNIYFIAAILYVAGGEMYCAGRYNTRKNLVLSENVHNSIINFHI
jgi:hypothetical protein